MQVISVSLSNGVYRRLVALAGQNGRPVEEEVSRIIGAVAKDITLNERECALCGRGMLRIKSPTLPGVRKSRIDREYCSDACRQRAYRLRVTPPLDDSRLLNHNV